MLEEIKPQSNKFDISKALEVPTKKMMSSMEDEERKSLFLVKRDKRELSQEFSIVLDSICRLPVAINSNFNEEKLKRLLKLFIGMSCKLNILEDVYIDNRNKEIFKVFEKISKLNFKLKNKFIAENINFIEKNSAKLADEIKVEKAINKLFERIDSITKAQKIFKISDDELFEILAYALMLKSRTSQKVFIEIMLNTVQIILGEIYLTDRKIKDSELTKILYGFSEIDWKKHQ